MKYNFRKTGINFLLISIVFLFFLSKIGVSLNIRLFLGSFAIGTSIFLIFFGEFNPDEDENEEER